MKLEDLFIGAWVQPKNENAPFRVYLVDGEGVCDKNETVWCLDEIEPVPLTFEFMTKYFPADDIVSWNPVTTYNCHYFYCAVGGEDSKRSVSGDFYYVHELQAALRLCGITHEI